MLSKIYLALFAVAVLVILTVTFLTYTQLQSIGFPPPQIVENFSFYDSLLKTILWISSVILLILANVILWTNRTSWALWLTFGYFAVFILLNMWWLGDSLHFYKKQQGLSEGSFQLGGIFAALMVVIVGIGVFFNQFIVYRLHDKMFNKTQDISEVKETIEAEKPETEQ
jgi:hypothetical protein